MAEKTIRLHKARLIEGVLVALIIISLLNLFIVYTITRSVGSAAAKNDTGAAKVPELRITKISSSCDDCFDVDSLVSAINQSGVSVQSERSLDASSSEAKQLISKYSISRLPALVIIGDVGEVASLAQFAEKVDDAYVFRLAPPPYVNATTGEVVGVVSVTLVTDSSCAECFNITSLPLQLGQVGVKLSGITSIDYASPEARALVARYNVTRVPFAMLSKDLSAYPEIVAGWSRLGTQDADGSFVLREIPPPYLSTASGEVKGRVAIFALNDSTCSSCYDVSLQFQILNNMGVFLSSNATYDVNSTTGREILGRYNITAVPTVVFSPDASVYPLLLSVWPQVGTIEPDGWFVFRNMAAIRGASYRNLTTGEVQTAPLPPAAATQ